MYSPEKAALKRGTPSPEKTPSRGLSREGLKKAQEYAREMSNGTDSESTSMDISSRDNTPPGDRESFILPSAEDMCTESNSERLKALRDFLSDTLESMKRNRDVFDRDTRHKVQLALETTECLRGSDRFANPLAAQKAGIDLWNGYKKGGYPGIDIILKNALYHVQHPSDQADTTPINTNKGKAPEQASSDIAHYDSNQKRSDQAKEAEAIEEQREKARKELCPQAGKSLTRREKNIRTQFSNAFGAARHRYDSIMKQSTATETAKKAAENLRDDLYIVKRFAYHEPTNKKALKEARRRLLGHKESENPIGKFNNADITDVINRLKLEEVEKYFKLIES